MCGRTACTLDPDDLRCACAYTNRKGQRRRPQWRQPPSSKGGGNANSYQGSNSSSGSNGKQGKTRQYFPSTNISPQSVTPVLLSSKHFDSDVEADEQSLTTMQWGLVPSWHKGDPSQVAYKMNNCRGESMMSKPIYKRPFEKGQRCVVLADGYYEWKSVTGSKKKQPYFIYMPQSNGDRLSKLHIESMESDAFPRENRFLEEGKEVEGDDKFKEWTGHRLLTMAGIFDRWIPSNEGEPLYTYSVITTEAVADMADIHHRMPVILDGDDEIRDWLDFGSVPSTEALKLVKGVKFLQFHPVSSQVNNSRYHGLDCVKPVEVGKPPESKSSNLMRSWLKKGSDTPTKKDLDSPKLKVTDTSVKKEIDMKQEHVDSPTKRKKSLMDEWIKKGQSPQKKIKYEENLLSNLNKEEAT
ncbi:abasic site processing protein HMCES-like [Anneissia japonica]|uniref:abasic site processing protein HMCES-like n=1 Tax=Anneissia japonica TaxID=1529436 RepID=UPI00142586F5|nr:abasic site processing protein HMCES-like [Anneissia japonica]